jgi:chromate reductase
MRVLGISGSLRAGSYNTMALREAQRLAPAGMAIEAATLHGIPLYDDDVRQQGYPPPVAQLRERIRAADGVLLVTPEYNHSVPGVLKNAVDWASRPPDQPFGDKPVALMSAARGLFGGVRAQSHLRQCFVFLDARVMSRPEVTIGSAHQRFDAAGRLTDETTAKLMGEFLAAFAAWIRRFR